MATSAQQRAPRPKAAYPGKVAIRHAIEAARDSGIDPRGFQLCPDGSILIFDRAALPVPQPAKDESIFDKLEREGKI